jgi:hypothetical protein
MRLALGSHEADRVHVVPTTSLLTTHSGKSRKPHPQGQRTQVTQTEQHLPDCSDPQNPWTDDRSSGSRMLPTRTTRTIAPPPTFNPLLGAPSHGHVTQAVVVPHVQLVAGRGAAAEAQHRRARDRRARRRAGGGAGGGAGRHPRRRPTTQGPTSLPMRATSALHRCCARLRATRASASGCMGRRARGRCGGRGRWRGFGRQPSSSEPEVKRGSAALGGVGERFLGGAVELVVFQTAYEGGEYMRTLLMGGGVAGVAQSMRPEDQSPEKGGVRSVPEASRASGRPGASRSVQERLEARPEEGVSTESTEECASREHLTGCVLGWKREGRCGSGRGFRTGLPDGAPEPSGACWCGESCGGLEGRRWRA